MRRLEEQAGVRWLMAAGCPKKLFAVNLVHLFVFHFIIYFYYVFAFWQRLNYSDCCCSYCWLPSYLSVACCHRADVEVLPPPLVALNFASSWLGVMCCGCGQRGGSGVHKWKWAVTASDVPASSDRLLLLLVCLYVCLFIVIVFNSSLKMLACAS